jgi:hypothetical protein
MYLHAQPYMGHFLPNKSTSKYLAGAPTLQKLGRFFVHPTESTQAQQSRFHTAKSKKASTI